MKIGILQPSYLPWLGYFEQIANTDVFVLYDDVQYDKNSWRNRNRIKTDKGAQWLTVPVLYQFRDRPQIREIEILPDSGWSRKHLDSIRLHYRKAPHFERYFPDLEKILGKKYKLLLDLDLAVIRWFLDCLGLRCSLHLSSELGVKGDKNERLIKICQHFGADWFYEGAAGKNYLKESLFQNAGIRVEYQDYQHPIYPQLHGNFVPYLSTLDLLLNCGAESLKIILGNKPTSWKTGWSLSGVRS